MRHEFDFDFMALGAHADDVELGCGGSIAKMVAEGKKGVIVDLCDASAATRGNSEDRIEEAKKAAKILGVNHRENLGLPDAKLTLNEDSLERVVEVIRKYRPRLLITHCHSDFHPDHNATHRIVNEAWYKSSLKSLFPSTEGRPFRAPYIMDITFSVNISFI